MLGCSVMMLCLLFYWQNVSNSVGTNLLFLLNIVGIYIGHLLAKKQLNFNSRYADKLCSLFSKSDCNNVLDSKAARLWGLISWSEIGLGYFISNMLILLFIPQYVVYVALLNLCIIPYVSKSESEAMVSSLFVGAGFVYRNADCGCCLWIYIHAGNSPE